MARRQLPGVVYVRPRVRGVLHCVLSDRESGVNLERNQRACVLASNRSRRNLSPIIASVSLAISGVLSRHVW